MTHLYKTLRDRNAKLTKDQMIAVPFEPSLGMILAAADASNVFTRDDQLWQWFSSYEKEPEDTYYVDESLIARFGVQKAFAMTCLADMWRLAVEGVDIWLRDRSRNPFHTSEAGDLLYYIPDHMPEGGWPATKDDITDDQKTAGRCVQEPYSSYFTSWYDFDPFVSTIAPKRMTSRVASASARGYLSASSFLDSDEAIDTHRMPFVPGWAKAGYWDEEERQHIVFAAMWRAAVEWLMSEEQTDADPFPYHETTQVIVLSNLLYRHPNLLSKVPDFFTTFPFNRICITTDTAMISVATVDGETSYWYQETESNRFIRSEGFHLRVGRDTSGLCELVFRLSNQNGLKVDAIPLSIPFGEGTAK